MATVTPASHAKPIAPINTSMTANTATRPAQLRKLLSRKNGATLTQIQTSFDWLPHTARAAISRLRKAGDVVDRSDTRRGSVYRIAPAKAAS